MGATMDKILIVGLGLIGGSYAKGLTKKGYEVYAYNRNKDAIDYAKEHGIIIDGTNEYSKNFICNFDRIIFSLYPKIFKEYIENFGSYIKDGAIISDVTGVKESIVADIQNVLGDRVEFIAAHPMAGKEVYGIENADEKIFENANYIITPTEKNTDKGIAFAEEIGKILKFRKVSYLTVKEHDEMIAFLSQLTHCIAVSLMTCKNSKELVNYTGDSFRDLTRIANINENMWTELFLANKDSLLMQMNRFEIEFNKMKEYLIKDDVDKIKGMMIESTKRRELFDKKNSN